MNEFVQEPIEVGLACRDLNTPNAICDVLESLQHLNRLVDVVFGNVAGKIAEETARLDDVNGRLNAAQTGITNITGQSRATTVFSTAKFPAPKTLPDYERLHVGDYTAALGKPYMEPDEEKMYTVGDARASPLASGNQVQQLLDMFKMVNAHGTDNLDPAFTMEREGLGRIPRTAGSTGELLLYNSTQTPYKAYRCGWRSAAGAAAAVAAAATHLLKISRRACVHQPTAFSPLQHCFRQPGRGHGAQGAR